MKYFGYIWRNARRNPIRSALTIASVAISMFLMMILLSFLAINSETVNDLKMHNRLITISSQGFSQPVPIALVRQAVAMDGVVAASPMNYFGGMYQEESLPFAQYGVDADVIFSIYEEFPVATEQLESFRQDRSGCIIGRKLADERKIEVGDRLPLKGTIYPCNLDLTVRGIFDGPSGRDLRACWFHWDYLEESRKQSSEGRGRSGNAGAIVVKCRTTDDLTRVAEAIDGSTRNSDAATRTQTEESFVRIFLEMYGDVRGLIRNVGLAVVFSLFCVAGNAMAMSIRERVTEIAVLKAIGFTAPRVLFFVLAEAVLLSVLGGLIGALGAKLIFDVIDVSRYGGGMVPIFYVPWSTALLGLGAAVLIGLASGFLPAINAARLSVVEGLRKVG